MIFHSLGLIFISTINMNMNSILIMYIIMYFNFYKNNITAYNDVSSFGTDS